MKDKMVIGLMLVISALSCKGQSFLSKYPEVTKKNLSEFFSDWVVYSDSLASRAVKNDYLIDMVVRDNYIPILIEERVKKSRKYSPPKYLVVPQYIKVERYYLDVDTVNAGLYFGFKLIIPDIEKEQYVVDSITPVLPWRCLYLTSEIEKKLSSFVGGLKEGDKFGKIDKKNVNALKKYIPVDYGHWGGYWWFTSFPMIMSISYADNLIAVMRRTSWWTGDEIWYVKEGSRFVRQPEEISVWCE